MSAKQNVSVTVNKETLRKLSDIDPSKPLKTLVDQAIIEYIANRTLGVTNKTPDIRLLSADMVPKQSYMLKP
jgi:hypothetical protein